MDFFKQLLLLSFLVASPFTAIGFKCVQVQGYIFVRGYAISRGRLAQVLGSTVNSTADITQLAALCNLIGTKYCIGFTSNGFLVSTTSVDTSGELSWYEYSTPELKASGLCMGVYLQSSLTFQGCGRAGGYSFLFGKYSATSALPTPAMGIRTSLVDLNELSWVCQQDSNCTGFNYLANSAQLLSTVDYNQELVAIPGDSDDVVCLGLNVQFITPPQPGSVHLEYPMNAVCMVDHPRYCPQYDGPLGIGGYWTIGQFQTPLDWNNDTNMIEVNIVGNIATVLRGDVGQLLRLVQYDPDSDNTILTQNNFILAQQTTASSYVLINNTARIYNVQLAPGYPVNITFGFNPAWFPDALPSFMVHPGGNISLIYVPSGSRMRPGDDVLIPAVLVSPITQAPPSLRVTFYSAQQMFIPPTLNYSALLMTVPAYSLPAGWLENQTTVWLMLSGVIRGWYNASVPSDTMCFLNAEDDIGDFTWDPCSHPDAIQFNPYTWDDGSSFYSDFYSALLQYPPALPDQALESNPYLLNDSVYADYLTSLQFKPLQGLVNFGNPFDSVMVNATYGIVGLVWDWTKPIHVGAITGSCECRAGYNLTVALTFHPTPVILESSAITSDKTANSNGTTVSNYTSTESSESNSSSMMIFAIVFPIGCVFLVFAIAMVVVFWCRFSRGNLCPLRSKRHHCNGPNGDLTKDVGGFVELRSKHPAPLVQGPFNDPGATNGMSMPFSQVIRDGFQNVVEGTKEGATSLASKLGNMASTKGFALRISTISPNALIKPASTMLGSELPCDQALVLHKEMGNPYKRLAESLCISEDLQPTMVPPTTAVIDSDLSIVRFMGAPPSRNHTSIHFSNGDLASLPVLCDVNLSIKPNEIEVDPEDKVLGSGAFGAVYKAWYKDCAVAVKVINHHDLDQGMDEDERKALQVEVDILSRVSHPNVVRLLGASLEPPQIFFVMELMSASLGDLLYNDDDKLSLRRKLQLALDTAKGLKFLHPGIVHRDLKPANILIDRNGKAKISDFGLARCKYHAYLSTKQPDQGTVAYMAPECFNPEVGRLSAKCDIYSFGVILWELLTETVPWLGESNVTIIFRVAIQGARPPLPTPADPACELPGLISLIKDCWAQTPSERPTCGQVVTRLEQVMSEHVAASSTVTPPTTGTTQGPTTPTSDTSLLSAFQNMSWANQGLWSETSCQTAPTTHEPIDGVGKARTSQTSHA